MNSSTKESVIKSRVIYVCLPVYNEEAVIKELVKSIADFANSIGVKLKIIAVNDGSTDSTAKILGEMAQLLPVEVLEHKINLGLGEAVKTALKSAVEKASDNDVVVTMDADNTHPVELIREMLDKIRIGADVVVASRYQDGAMESGVPFFRKVYSLCANNMLKLAFAYKGLNDYSSGYRAYKAVILKKAFGVYGDKFIEDRGFSAMPEIIIKLTFLKPVIEEVPLKLSYYLKLGKSKMNVGKTVAGYFRLIYRLRGMRK